MARQKKAVELIKYQVIGTGELYYGYATKDALTKDIDGEKYIEVTSSLSRPKISFIKFDSVTPVGTINHVPR